MKADNPLVTRMRAHAAAFPTLETAPEMTRLADELDAAVDAAFGVEEPAEGALKHMMGCWARARLFWCRVTGERLV